MTSYRVDFNAQPWEAPVDGLRCKAVKQGDRQLRLVEYTRNLEPHWCEKGHMGYVLEGRLEIEFEDQVLVFNPGDGIIIPSGWEHRHKGKVLTDVVRVVFVEDL